MLLLLFLLPSTSAFLSSLFGGGGCNPCAQQPQPYYPQPQQPYYPPPQPQPQYYPQPPPPQPSYYPPQPQGYVAAPHHTPNYRNPLRQYTIPDSSYNNVAPPSYRPTLSRSGYGNDFVGEGSIPLRSSVEGERATYVINRQGGNSLIVRGEEPVVTQPFVDEVQVETNEPATIAPTYTAPSYEPRVVESTSEFSGVEPTAPPTLQYPIEQQGYNSVPEPTVAPYEPAAPAPYNPEPVPTSNAYESFKRFAGFDQLRASGLARHEIVQSTPSSPSTLHHTATEEYTETFVLARHGASSASRGLQAVDSPGPILETGNYDVVSSKLLKGADITQLRRAPAIRPSTDFAPSHRLPTLRSEQLLQLRHQQHLQQPQQPLYRYDGPLDGRRVWIYKKILRPVRITSHGMERLPGAQKPEASSHMPTKMD
ncbi:hypothetical protein PRIPAC_77898 [Pristionchus pacificus]|uniref:Uncharacterized protein n=1 Tax=Pristionchus pacificus TaxID=54126 RepID=A0A2A6CBH4_PRIPA|nr:hypothetical protein PRIPAC_77898 [Pristionchus pacificus]|eukprot:PDM75575.1 hypothetical protein PRIPAC_42752 [Pristionchus pacificus]